MGASTEKGLSKRVNARVSNLYLFTMRNTFFFFSKITFLTLHFKKKYNGKSLWREISKKKRPIWYTFFKWLGFTFLLKTNYSRCSRKRESLRKKASKFPPSPSSQHHLSARCHSECEKIAWHHIANELLIMNICRGAMKPNTGKSDFANIRFGL